MASRSRSPSPLRVRVDHPGVRLHRKLESYFQSRQSGGGECTVRPDDRGDLGAFLVRFCRQEDKENVLKKKDHHLIVDDNKVKIYLEPTENPTQENTRSRKSSLTQLGGELMSDEKHPSEEYSPDTIVSRVQKIFLDVTAYLNCNLFSEEQRNHIPILCPNVKITEVCKGIEMLCGDFRDIEKIYHYLSRQLLEPEPKRGSSTLLEERQPLSPPNWSSSVTLPEEKQLHHSPERFNSVTPLEQQKPRTEEQSSHFQVPLLFLEYFKHISPNKIDSIEKRFGIKIKTQRSFSNMVNLDFIPSQSYDIEPALKSFVGEFQKVTETLGKEHISIPDNEKSHKIKQELARHFKKLLIKENERELTLIGAQDDITAAKHFLASSPPDNLTKISLKILPPGYMVNGIEFDTSQYKLLEPVLCPEIAEIEKKYNTRCFLEQSQKIFIKFEPKDKELDLSVHAYVNLIDAYQDIASQLTREILSLKSFSKKFSDDFRKNHPHVYFVPNEETVTLIGLPNFLTKAKQYVFEREGMSFLNREKQHGNHEITMDIDSNSKTASTTFQNSASAGDIAVDDKDVCSICMETISDKKVLPKCKHEFCSHCIDKAMLYKPSCPLCLMPYGVQKGNQPEGTMDVRYSNNCIPGYEYCGIIEIFYNMKGGIQTEEHPNPGTRYFGAERRAYLPNNKEGKEVLELLQKAFNQKLIFTVGYSRTTGKSNVITWNDIHHKTSIFGGPENYGYPDPDYLKRVKQELKDKGIE